MNGSYPAAHGNELSEVHMGGHLPSGPGVIDGPHHAGEIWPLCCLIDLAVVFRLALSSRALRLEVPMAIRSSQRLAGR